MDDLVERLRARACVARKAAKELLLLGVEPPPISFPLDELCNAAADRLAALEAERDAAREAGIREAASVARDHTPEKHTAALASHCTGRAIENAILAPLAAPADAAPAPFQDRVKPWMDACFGPEISNDRMERGDRFLEEALELLQSGGYPRERVASLVDYVFDRPVGDPPQEVGGVMVTLAAYCLAHGLDMHEAGETELARIWTKVEKIRAKQAAKPKGSALPVAAQSFAEGFQATVARFDGLSVGKKADFYRATPDAALSERDAARADADRITEHGTSDTEAEITKVGYFIQLFYMERDTAYAARIYNAYGEKITLTPVLADLLCHAHKEGRALTQEADE